MIINGLPTKEPKVRAGEQRHKSEDHRYRQAHSTAKSNEIRKWTVTISITKGVRKKNYSRNELAFPYAHFHGSNTHTYKNANSFLMLLFPCRSLFTLRKIDLFFHMLKQWNKLLWKRKGNPAEHINIRKEMCALYKLAKPQVFAMSNVKKVRLLKLSSRI